MVLVRGDLLLNTDTHSVYAGGESISLTKKEFEILACLMKSDGTVSVWTIANTVWGLKPIRTETVKVHVHNIREKIGKGRIVSVYGSGYRVVSVTVPEHCLPLSPVRC